MKRFFSVALMLTLVLVCLAQGNRKFDPEQFNAHLQQFITREAALTPQESAKFFPLYNELHKKQRALFSELKRLKRSKPAGSKACQECIKRCDEMELQMKQLQQTYHAKFLKVLPAEKVYDILKAEDRFHRQMFRNAKR